MVYNVSLEGFRVVLKDVQEDVQEEVSLAATVNSGRETSPTG